LWALPQIYVAPAEEDQEDCLKGFEATRTDGSPQKGIVQMPPQNHPTLGLPSTVQ